MKISEPFFSIIMPVYNRASLLETSIKSVINQQFHNFELLCINDGSTDDSIDILRQYEFSDNRIKVFNQSNQGRCLARNVGINNSSAKWICFLDSDDIYYDNHLAILKTLIDNNPDFCGFATSQLVGNKPKYDKKQYDTNNITVLSLDDFIKTNPIQLNQFCYNRIENPDLKFPPVNVVYSEDLLFIRQFCVNYIICKTNVVTNEVIDHNNRSMNVYIPQEFVKWNLFTAKYFINNFKVLKKFKNRILSHTYLLCANVLLKHHFKKEGFNLLRVSLNYYHSLYNSLLYKGIIKLLR